jgi:hypothetical protein
MKSKISKHFSTGLLLPIDISDLSFGRFFFEILQKLYPDLMPRKYGLTEPLKNIFDGDIEKLLLSYWKDGFIWKPTQKGTEAFWRFSTLFGKQRLHSELLIYGNYKKIVVDNIKLLYRELVRHTPADIGHIHILAEPEFKHYWNYHDEMISCLDIGFVTIKLKKYIGNFAWGMYFGKPYVEMMGLEKLLKSPAYLVEQWHDGVYIQVTDNIEDTFLNYEEFDKKRTRIKEYLGPQYFFNPDFGKNDYRVPDFDFSIH